jgi:aryl-alcohol dehydrogenase-like predicted oxidoreductase/enamine deaminase RidA (YjgF/YER057c/UK114 family)
MKAEQTLLAPGLSISRVLTGLWQIADMERDGKTLDADATAKMMVPYAEAGLTTFDMADHYGSSEIIAGLFRKKYAGLSSPKLFTKWVPEPGPVSKSDVRAAVQRAMERMQTEQIDLMQFHAWNYADPRWLDCLFWLQELKDEGLIKHLGLTNFDTAHLSIAVKSGIPIVSNQVCYSLLDQRAAGAMTEFCLQHGIKILAFGTIAGGFLTEKWMEQPEPSMNSLATWSQMKYKRYIDAAGGWEKFQRFLQVIHTVARRNGVSISNVASKYILDQPAVAGVIIGARLGRSEHITENVRLSQFTLSEEDREEIHSAAKVHLDPIPGDCGDEYRHPPFLTASGDLSHHVDQFPAPFPSAKGRDGRTKVLTGTTWEDIAGFSRAVKKGNRILVSGTTATHGNRSIGGQDAAAQAHFVIDKIEGALQSLGSRLEDVVRTRIFIKNISDWEVIARVHGERFKDIQPANTMVRADLIGDEYLVEMEAEADSLTDAQQR